MPVMEPDLDATLLRDWARTIDDGPFSSLCWGERIAFTNPDSLTLLGALSAWTERVRLVTTVIVPQLHDPVLLAKALATGDLLSGGRLAHLLPRRIGADRTVVLVPAAYTEPDGQPTAAEHVPVRPRFGEQDAGEKLTESVLPVGPAPTQPGGPPLLVGTIGPKTVRSAASWAEGLAGITMDLDVAKQNELFDVARDAWQQAGRAKPHLATSFWFALGDREQARDQVRRHLLRYMNWIPAEYVEAMAPTTGWAGSEDELAEVLRAFAAVGTGEVHLIPTSSDLGQLRCVADVVADVVAEVSRAG